MNMAARRTAGCHIHALLHGLCANQALISSIGVLPSVFTGLCNMLDDQNFFSLTGTRLWTEGSRVRIL